MMKCHHIEARDLPDCWFQAVDLCYSQGRDYTITEGSYTGQKRRELDFVTIHVTHPQTEPLLPEIPPQYGLPNPVPEGMDYIARYLPYLMTDRIEPGETYTYGNRLFAKTQVVTGHGVAPAPSQIEEIIAKFKRGFGNNQCCATIALPSDVHSPDPPCLRLIDFRVYPGEEALHMVTYWRSWDCYCGMPANLAALAYLQEFVAMEIGIKPGEIIACSKGLHLYDMYWPLARARLGENA
jgi:thymidylate synthase